ncbi:sulfatase-like hydrolase/transferase [Marinoscillum sp. MHG1-6]|uniref:sulfatase-like hydrolase/transferase n=1 Tax=Marinoscillum sp. MHG1-6 TaxID=2959627 RepID=UPI002157A7EC|nr:sulfatase-like hydrolase/transferase [Marinoscillum sp. MHG1-6]
MKRLWYLIFGLVVASLVFIACSKGNTSKSRGDSRPNIIIILADDAGYADFGFMGSKDILTPNLDALAKDGVIFTDAHVSASVCSPSRAGLLTGRYQQRFGHECNLEPGITNAFDSVQVTVAEYLKLQGYQTSIFGKWHLGEAAHQHPLSNGFDYFWGFLAGGRSYFPDAKDDEPGNIKAILENYTPVKFDDYLTDAIGNQAAGYIEDQARNADPFFMYLAFNAPHTPMHAKAEVIRSFGEAHARPVYAAMLWSMDEAIGKVINQMKNSGIYDNTLIFFLSDNGGAHNNNSSVAPLKGWKGNQYEGGTRVPFLVIWKAEVEGGRKFDGLTSSLDIYGTIAVVAGKEPTTDNKLDGVNILPYLNGDREGNPHDILYWRKDEMSTIRNQNMKYITSEDSLEVMYDLDQNLGETDDLSSMYPDMKDSLKAMLSKWESGLPQPYWKEAEDWNEVTRIIYRDLMSNTPPTVKNPKDLEEHLN